jgi:hypothetical protein
LFKKVTELEELLPETVRTSYHQSSFVQQEYTDSKSKDFRCHFVRIGELETPYSASEYLVMWNNEARLAFGSPMGSLCFGSASTRASLIQLC